MRRRHQQGGYVLLTVIGALAVVAFIALRFAERIDDLRRNAVGFNEYVNARANVSSARATTLYWLATRPLALGGHGGANGMLREDDRPYRFADGAIARVQDARGLVSLNAGNRQALLNLLVADGLDVQRAQAYVDVLDDYIDTDGLRRLNGAEREDYAALGLPPPRNDWMLSLRELEGMPLWRDDRARLERLSRTIGLSLSNQFNPLTASPDVLRATLAGASAAQLELLMTLRSSDLLNSGAAASRLTGLALDSDDILFVPGWESRLTFWAPGLPRALEYNARLTPAGPTGPWVITEQHSTVRPNSGPQQANEFSAAPLFPLSSAASAQPTQPASAAAP